MKHVGSPRGPAGVWLPPAGPGGPKNLEKNHQKILAAPKITLLSDIYTVILKLEPGNFTDQNYIFFKNYDMSPAFTGDLASPQKKLASPQKELADPKTLENQKPIFASTPRGLP